MDTEYIKWPCGFKEYANNISAITETNAILE